MLAAGTRLAGDRDEAVALYTESLELNRRLGDTRMVAIELHNLGHVELHRGNLDAAERRFADRARLHNPDDLYEAAMTHLNQAALAFVRGDSGHAAELLRRTDSTLDNTGIVLDPDDAFEVAWLSNRLDASPADEGPRLRQSSRPLWCVRPAPTCCLYRQRADHTPATQAVPGGSRS